MRVTLQRDQCPVLVPGILCVLWLPLLLATSSVNSGVSDAPMEECQVTPVIHVLQYPGCVPKPIPSFACTGRCSSYVQVSGSKIWQMERSCMCCQESGEREASVSLFCPKAKAGERKFRKVTTKAPIDCMCRPCTTVEESAIIPQEIAGYENEGPLQPAANFAEECQVTPVIHVLQFPGCVPKPIPSFACNGRCSSYVQVSGSKIWQMERSCMCCQESGEREASVSLFCPKAKAGERKFRKVTTKAPLECMCRPCTSVEESAVIPQEMAGYPDQPPLNHHFTKQ
uniref:Bursicon n=2 Tax=Timema TaxID=61471 RepID=A0A7R9JXB3_TIMGE|nr:unnamed protein product [Timema genevievae]